MRRGPPDGRTVGEHRVLWLNDVRGGLVETGIAPDGARGFLRVTGKSTQRVTLAGDPFRMSIFYASTHSCAR
jgi:hypothetical protein